jgi:hypothetical protein
MIFWLVYVIVLLFGGYLGRGRPDLPGYYGVGGLVMLLIGLLGWGEFGFIIK